MGPNRNVPAVIVDDVSKSFSVPRERMHTLKERALHPFRRRQFDVLQALKGVSFAVEQGEFFGIVGRNGSGKSTLLKCLAGIYGVDSGGIYLNGRLSTFIELGVGFNPALAARDNAMINAIMLGLGKREAVERYERILDFSELHEFEDMKIKNYSSGMLVRLAFSVMIQVDADILLIDEVLAVGDASFQQKCFDEFARLRDERRTILFVTHDMGAVQRFCDRALLLERGNVIDIGAPDMIGDRYFAVNFAQGRAAVAPDDADRRGDGTAEITHSWFEDEHGESSLYLPQGRPCTFLTRIVFHEEMTDPSIVVVFEDSDHRPVFAASSEWQGVRTGHFAPGDETIVRIAFDNPFSPGRLWATPSVARKGAGNDVADRRSRYASVMITGSRTSGGLVDLPYDLSLDRPARVVEQAT